jgi:hypothetical protein
MTLEDGRCFWSEEQPKGQPYHCATVNLKDIIGEMKKQHDDKNNKLTLAGFLVLSFAFLISCAGTSKMSPFQIDEMLVRSGFQLHTADTPEKLDFLKSLPKNKFLHKMHNKKLLYFYMNDVSCQCMYVGNKKAYLHFKKSVKENQMDERIDTTSSEARQDMENFPFGTNNPFDAEDHLP